MNDHLTIYQKAETEMTSLQQSFTEKNETPVLLVVDDEPDYLSLVAAWITPLNWFAELALSGRAALAIMDRRKIDLIWLDYRMIEMNAVEFIIQAKARAGKRPPIIVVTGMEITPEIRRLLDELDVFIIANKPINSEQLIDLLKRVNPKTVKQVKAKQYV